MKNLKLNIKRFSITATNSATVKNSTSGNKGTIKTTFTETSVNNTTNKSTISITGSIKMTVGAFSQLSNTHLRIYWYDNYTNSETLVAQKDVTSLSTGSTSSVSGTIEVTHKSDGSLAGYSITKWVYNGSGQYAPASGNVQTANTNLTTIPRGTDVPSINGFIGMTTTIGLNPKNSSYRHTLRYTFGSLTNQTIASNVASSYSWTMPNVFYGEMTTSETSKTGTLYVDTYDGNNLVQTKSGTFTANISESLGKPVITISSVLDTNNTSTTYTQDNTTFVEGVSTATVTYSISSPTSANISSVLINNNSVSTSATSYDIIKVASKIITIVVTDSRGFSTTSTYTIANNKWIEYRKPSITASYSRVDDVSTYITLNVEENYAVGFENDVSTNYRFKESGGSYNSWRNFTTVTKNNGYINITENVTIDPEKGYTFQIRVVDPFNTVTYLLEVPKASPVCWWNNTDFTMNNNFIYTTMSQSSTEDIKENFKLLGDVSEIIKYFKIYSYDLKKDKYKGKRHYGFVIPTSVDSKFEVPEQVVSGNGRGIDIYSMCSILWRAVQEQQKEIEELKRKNFDIDKKI